MVVGYTYLFAPYRDGNSQSGYATFMAASFGGFKRKTGMTG
jgi:hypothetical protein